VELTINVTKNGQIRLLNNIASPFGLAMIAYVFFLLACIIPPSVYSHYMQEPDLMFLDPGTILFYSLCVISFAVGVWLIGWIFPSPLVECRLQTRISPVSFLLAPLTLGISVTAISTYILFKKVPDIIVLLLSQQGDSLKETLAFDLGGNYTLAPLLLIGVTWWAFSRYSSFSLDGWKRQLVRIFLFVAVLTEMISSTLILIRSLLMLTICGLAILYLIRKATRRQISPKLVLGGGVAIFLCLSLLFIALSFIRGTADWDDQISSLLGYSAASYNRLAAIINGNLRYPYGGYGEYIGKIVLNTHRLPFKQIMNPPDATEVWGSEFGAVSQAGLNGSLIWSGTFGDIFSDLGWFSLPFVFGYGLLYGVVWSWARQGKVFGVVMYPFFGFCVLFWLGTNYLVDTPMELMLLAAVLLTVYEFAFVLKSQESAIVETPLG
jgi:hypothetical protein